MTPVARVLCAKHMRKAETSILGGLWEASQVPHGELDLEGGARFPGQSRGGRKAGQGWREVPLFCTLGG